MRALLDVNVLLALFDLMHLHHQAAADWWKGDRHYGWASCPLTQNGFVRVITLPSYQQPLTLPRAREVLRKQIAAPGHEFWPDDISVLDAEVFDDRFILGPGQITDAYLLGLAVKNDGRLVTFDRTISRAAVRGAQEQHLVVI